jgi:hypothetical protein
VCMGGESGDIYARVHTRTHKSAVTYVLEVNKRTFVCILSCVREHAFVSSMYMYNIVHAYTCTLCGVLEYRVCVCVHIDRRISPCGRNFKSRKLKESTHFF